MNPKLAESGFTACPANPVIYKMRTAGAQPMKSRFRI